MALPQLLDAFQARFNAEPQIIVRAPGRVNLLGEHTDYNEGFALPFAIEAAIMIALRARDDKTIHVFSESFNESRAWPNTADANDDETSPDDWSNYLKGVVTEFRKRGTILVGTDVLIHGELPIGMGVSSSAALTVGYAKAYALLCHEVFDTREFIAMCADVEHNAMNVPCGTLDQTAILNASGGHVMFLDCRTQEITQIPLARAEIRFLLIDIAAPRKLAASHYARRRKECAQAAEYFCGVAPGVRSLRDVTTDMVKRHASQIPPAIALRALHVATENERVLAGAMALKKADWAAFGRLMTAAHESLRDNFEASTPEIDRLVDALTACDGVLGARLTGGGFGGAIIALAKRDALDDIKDVVNAVSEGTRSMDSDTKQQPPRFQWVHPGDGVSILRA